MSSNQDYFPQRPQPTIRSPDQEQRYQPHREQQRRHRRPSDVEGRPRHHRRRSSAAKGPADPSVRPVPSPNADNNDNDPMMFARGSGDVTRKKSLVRPERRRVDRNDPDYYYRKHAQNMTVQPSTTGVDPMMDEEVDATTSTSSGTNYKKLHRSTSDENLTKPQSPGKVNEKRPRPQRKLTRQDTREADKAKRQIEKDKAAQVPSLWGVYCQMVTIWCPDALLRCFGKPQKPQQRAWREKMGLISIILLICLFVGYLTFGFTATVCPPNRSVRLRVNEVDRGFLIVHGTAYDLSRSHHPYARGIPDGANVLYDLPEKHGGQDASFLFQNVNGHCKGLINSIDGSGVPTNTDGSVGWYFPCQLYNQDGSSRPNDTQPYYMGYSCHLSDLARNSFYGLRSTSTVYFTWDDVRNTSRNLAVYGSDVLDLNLLTWFNRSQVTWPARFDEIRENPAIRGVDLTLAFTSQEDKQIAQCFQEIIKVGSIDTATIGCIASKVVLYVSLVFILSIVVVKFLLALAFQWFLCRKFGASKGVVTNDKKRNQQIEDWSDDIYRPPPKFEDSYAGTVSERSTRTSAFLPTKSRFTSPYAMDGASSRGKPGLTTMANQTQNSTSKLVPAPMGYQSDLSLPQYSRDSRTSMFLSEKEQRLSGVVTEVEGPGPAGFIHEAVVPQPPPEWQPFGYPLAHAICLVTAYSEGADGLRTTFDSIATTDYPNSHKIILAVCDGLIKGRGEEFSTPEIVLSMMKDHTILPDEVQPFSYVAVASGSKRHNMAKIYSGFYDYGENSRVPLDKQHRVPMVAVVKCGTPDEATKAKPGNRGKRDSQIILMSFLQKVMFDERMTELEFEMFNGIWKITGISPDFYEVVLMVDADTKVFPDSLTHMCSAMVKDPEIMGLCGETKIANKRASWVTRIQVFEYFISHHLAKSFESVFGGVTCLPGCFSMYRIKAPKGGQNYWVPILANPDIVEHYSENVVDTLHKKNLYLLGEDRYLSTLMLKTFPKRKQVFVPQAICKTTVPEEFKVLLSQRRRWINSTIHNLMELVLVRELCGTFCFSMQFVVFIELVGTLVLPAAIAFTIYLIIISIVDAARGTEIPVIPLVLLALILGLPAVLIVLTAHRWSYVYWMMIYLLALPIWNGIFPAYAYWKFDDFSWGETRKTSGETTKKAGLEYEGEFDSSKITMKRWGDFEQERRLRAPGAGWREPAHQHTQTSGYQTQALTGRHSRSQSGYLNDSHYSGYSGEAY